MKCSIASYLFIFLAGVLLVSSCQNRPKEVLKRKEMERLLYDVYLAEATMENEYHRFNSPEKKEAYINRVFALHGVSQAQWDTSLSWYSDRIDLYLKMNDSVKVRLDRARKEVDGEIGRLAARKVSDPRTLSPSYIPSYYSFSGSAAERGFRFHLNEYDVKERITDDQFTYTYSVIGIPPLFPPRITSLLTLEYGDTSIYLPQQITENKTYRTIATKYLPEDTLRNTRQDTLRHIYGYIHLLDSLNSATHIQLYHISLGDDVADSTLSVVPMEEIIVQDERSDTLQHR
ncbi:MAG: DUF4296 domain-containing protein [Proteiniphilum sp.]|nr:DUF4296 domain-containing protein [Proteiniphilum sp.]MDD2725779.1 DUF4296 domain-containing protein [Proteiniphilum sp.]MDD3331827.1 DUF4296 domain-containing protein [Proteiniphilum sp.]MDD3555012.1 DUF4296 domain-containing protein [Proteiniphilum sp.]MDD3978588.1 DUF4296 domain-containing protein [Proteiniphilum sp.]